MDMTSISPTLDSRRPAPMEKLDSPESSPSKVSNSKLGAGITPKKLVTISFEEKKDSDSEGEDSNRGSLITGKTTSFSIDESSRNLLGDCTNDDVDLNDVKVHRFGIGCSYFAFKSTGKTSRYMEARAAWQKYRHQHECFMKVSLLMALCTLSGAIHSITKSNVVHDGEHQDEGSRWIRFGLLMGVVFTLYLFYSWFACAKKTSFLHSSGTWKEWMLVIFFLVQGIAIAVAEYSTGDEDNRTWHGTVVLHLIFIHNFTPLSSAGVQLTTLFSLAVHLALTLVTYLNHDEKLDQQFLQDKEMCIHTRGKARLLLALLVPCILLLYQNFISLRRDRGMREDLLSSVQERAHRQQMQVERSKCEGLLRSMLPRQVIEALKANRPVEPQLFPDCTVIFVEVCNFSQLCAKLPVQLCVDVLDGVYTELDRLSDLLHVYKVETINQVYMAVVGCPELITNHADVACSFGLAAQHAMPSVRSRIADGTQKQEAKSTLSLPSPTSAPRPISSTNFSKRIQDDTTLQIRVGVNSGPVRAGVVGLQCPRYKLIGDTVNTASRMESTCLPGKVQASPSTQEKLTPGMFNLEDRGDVEVKGKGAMRLAFVSSYADTTNHDRMEVMIEHGVQQSHDTMMYMPNQPQLDRSERSHDTLKTDMAIAGSVGLGSYTLTKPQNYEAPSQPNLIQVRTPEVIQENSSALLIQQLSGESGELADDEAMSGGDLRISDAAKDPGWDSPPASPVSPGGLSKDSHGSNPLHESPSAKTFHTRSTTNASLVGMDGDHGVAAGRTRVQRLSGAMTYPPRQFAKHGRSVGNAMNLRLPAVHTALRKENWLFNGERTPTTPGGRTDGEVSVIHRIYSRGERRWIQLYRWFLFTSEKLKNPELLMCLSEDRPRFLEDTLQTRIAFARNLTQTWLLVISAVSAVDYFMDVVEEDVERYRTAVVFRALGNIMSGLVYLMLITSASIFRAHAEKLTTMLLLAQGFTMHVVAFTIYNNETGIVALYGAYVLSYTVLRYTLRLPLTFLAMVGYATVEMIRCDPDRLLKVLNNVAFLFVFFVFLASGVRLEEHLEHVAHFEKRGVKAQIQSIESAKAVGDQLLHGLLPAHIVEEMNKGNWPRAERYPDVTIIFTDIKNFTPYCAKISVSQLVEFLNTLFSAFDDVLDLWGLFKVEVIGDAYFVSSGCPLPMDPAARCKPQEYAMRAVEVALALQRTLPNVCDDPKVQMRVGIHTGEVLAGVVGKKGPRYHLFGQTVAFAEKMESSGMPQRVQISETTHKWLVSGGYQYDFEQRADPVVDENGSQATWWVTRSTDGQSNAVKRGLIMQRRGSKPKITPVDASTLAGGESDKKGISQLRPSSAHN